MAYFFHLKMSDFLSLLFSENAQTRTDIDVIKMADFSSPFSFQNTHTRTDMNFTKWLICFISKCLNFYSCGFLKRRTHAQILMLQRWQIFHPHFLFKTLTHAQIYRYKFYKMADFFISKCLNIYPCFFSENAQIRKDIDVIKMADFSSPFSFQNTHTRTDMNFAKWLICFISKCLNFHSCGFLKRRTHAQISML